MIAPAAKYLLTSREAAAALSISPRTLWSLTAAGEIPVVRINRLVRYSPADLEAFAQKRRDGSKAGISV